MKTDVNGTRIRANQFTQYVYWLAESKNKMKSYRSQIAGNWIGAETRDILRSIDQVIVSLDKAIDELNEISRDMVRAADTIYAEEEKEDPVIPRWIS